MPGKRSGKTDCGIRAVANALGLPYMIVKRRFGRLRNGMEFGELEWLLSEFATWKLWRQRLRITPAEWVARHDSGRHILVLEELADHHALAVVNGQLIGRYDTNSIVLWSYTIG